MYQKYDDKNEKVDIAIMAADIADWSITRYGYFINSSVDKLEMIQAFAEELERLPTDALNFISNAKEQWIDYDHKRPPTMPDFLTMLRSFHNADVKLKVTPKIEERKTDYWGIWENCDSGEQKAHFFNHIYNQNECPSSIKWAIRKELTENGISSKIIRKSLGGNW